MVANGDISRANFAGDYSSRLTGTENIADQDYFVLEFTAVDRSIAYQRVKCWVRQSSYFPHGGKFYFWIYRWGNCRLGGIRPARLAMKESSFLRLEMYFEEMEGPVPDKGFLRRITSKNCSRFAAGKSYKTEGLRVFTAGKLLLILHFTSLAL